MEQFFIIGNIPFHNNLIIFANLIDDDITSGRTHAHCHPMVSTCFSLIELLFKCIILECVIIEGNPIVISCLERRGIACISLNFLCPIIRLFYHFKFNGNIRTADLIQLDFYQEERNIIISMVIQPFDSSTMFFSCSLYNPNYNIGTFSGCICNQFTEVVMVCIFKLILDDDFSVRSGFSCINIYIEIANARFSFINGYLQANGIRQQRKIIFLCKPRRKVYCLVRPYLSQVFYFFHFS